MKGYVARRLVVLAVALVAASTLTFLLLSLSPGDPAEIILTERMGGERPSPQVLEQFQRELGLDRPVHQRYLLWAGRCLTGDLGYSFRTGEPIAGELGRRLANTLPLAVLAILVSLFVAAPTGIACAKRPGRLLDRTSLGATFLLLSTPPFLAGIVLVLAFAVAFQVFPAEGSDLPAHFVLPALTLGIPLGAQAARFTRATLLEVLGEDYIRTARAKGLDEGVVVRRHALRNVLPPVVTLLALQFRNLAGGVVIVESLFAFRGVGSYLVDGILLRDYPVVQACVLVFVVLTLLITLATDMAYAVLSPGVRLGDQR